MDQVERALLVVSGDAASGKLVADSQVSHVVNSSNTGVLYPSAPATLLVLFLCTEDTFNHNFK